MGNKRELYKLVKIAGILSFLPFILAGGVGAGYFLGDFLWRKFISAYFIFPVCIGIGIIISVIEAVKIIKLAITIDKKP